MRTAMSRADRQARTRADLIQAADRLFTRHGFHATSLDAIADEAGYTKGAVYSNFSAKEDLFFAVYAERVQRSVADLERRFAREHDFSRVMVDVAAATSARRTADDGWLAVFFEFWAHVLRHPEHRARFAELHAAAIEPAVKGLTRHADERGVELPDDPRKLATAWYAMQVGLSLEQLTQPDVVDSKLGARMARLAMQDLRGGDDA